MCLYSCVYVPGPMPVSVSASVCACGCVSVSLCLCPCLCLLMCARGLYACMCVQVCVFRGGGVAARARVTEGAGVALRGVPLAATCGVTRGGALLVDLLSAEEAVRALRERQRRGAGRPLSGGAGGARAGRGGWGRVFVLEHGRRGTALVVRLRCAPTRVAGLILTFFFV